MKLTLIKKHLFYTILISSSLIGFSQTEEEKKQITAQYNTEKAKALEAELLLRNQIQKQKIAIGIAKNGWRKQIIKADGSFDELVGVLPNGTPLYYTMDNNSDAARSTRTNHLNTGGSLGLNLNGQNMTGGVWDGGPTRLTHQEFGGRMTSGDNNTSLNGNSFHATHVTGTVGASGIQANAKGMAPAANVKTFDWNDDELEAFNEAQNGLLLSNHSYGTLLSPNLPTWFIGAYSFDARVWDQIAYTFPFYLMVTSAGNNGDTENSEPSTFGFDKLNGNKNAKNNLVIANAEDAAVASNGSLIAVAINPGSSQGPSDDSRIKPDITGNGTGLYSTNSTSNTSYTTLSGTSMSGPNVMGSLLLLQQHHNNLHQRFMRAATLKALACHTADDAGRPGPDAEFGWGLLNCRAAALAISNNGLSSWISEEKLTSGQPYSITVKSTPNTPLVASIVWTDVPGIANSGIVNDPTPALVNNLDIKIVQGTNTFYPWRLQSDASLNAIRDGENNVDNVENVKIDNANGGNYTIIVSNKGNLVEGPQNFSLVITGISSTFGFVPVVTERIVCANENANFPFSFRFSSGTAVNLTATNVPTGATVSFSNNNLNANGTFTVTFSTLSNVVPGEYVVGIVGNNGIETETRFITLRVLSATFQNVNLLSPANGAAGISSSTQLTWNRDLNAENYIVEVATDPAFLSIIATFETTASFVNVTDLMEKTVYYWRVKPSNRCGSATSFSVFNFQTGELNCDINYVAEDYSNGFIDSVPNSEGFVSIFVPENFTIGDVNVSLEMTHTWVQDMTIYLDGPASLGSPRIILFEEPCGGEDDINVILDDSGTDLECGSNPAISGTVIPLEPLSSLSGLSAEGEWKLSIIDRYNQDGGQVNNFALNFCNITPIIQSLSFTNTSITTNINSSKIINNTEMLAFTPNESNINQVYTLIETPINGVLRKNGVPLSLGNTFTQADIDANGISYTNTLLNEAQDTFKVNVLNATNSWIANRIIPINIVNPLSTAIATLEAVKVYPNPTTGKINISIPDNFDSPTQISVFDIQGRRVIEMKDTSKNIELDLAPFQEGLYLLQLENRNEKSIKKIVLQR